MPLPLDPQPARTHEATRAALARSGLRVLGCIALGTTLAVVVVLLVRDGPRRYAALLSHGTRTSGVVDSANQDGRGLAIFRHRIRVVYLAGGRWHSTTVWLDENARRYSHGESVPVVYESAKPAVATVIGEWNVVWWQRMAEWFLGMFAAILVAVAPTMSRSLWRTWRALHRRPWIASEYSISIGSRHVPTFMILTPNGRGDQFLQLKVKAPPHRLNPFRTWPPSVVWVATEGDGRPVAVATPGAGHLYTVRAYEPTTGRRRRLLALRARTRAMVTR